MECVVLPFGSSSGRGERILCLGFAWRYYGLGLTVKGFLGDVCRVLGFLCHLERDFRVWGSQNNFRGFRENFVRTELYGLV